jgi:Glucose dehydrogenase
MRRTALAFLLLATSTFLEVASANESVLRAVSNPANWVLQTGDYANHRYSTLDQINRDNVMDLEVAWQFSTGVLRGHEGAPLVIGSVMYVHTPFPNKVYALDLNRDGHLLWEYKPEQDPSVMPSCAVTPSTAASPTPTA